MGHRPVLIFYCLIRLGIQDRCCLGNFCEPYPLDASDLGHLGIDAGEGVD